MLKPKRSINHLKETASRQFTDREEPKKSFTKAFQSLQSEQYKVLVFYGVGGIGKSRLMKELYSLTDTLDDSAIKVSIDFREEKHRDPAEALIWLRQQLTKQYNIKFTTFDLAYAVYWSRMKPQLTLKSERKTIPFLEEGNFVGELITQLENLPIVQWIPKTIKLIDGISNYKEILQWWNGMGKEILTDLKEMHPKDIEDMLLVYWATDLINWQKKTNKKVIFFFDTYEALWEKDRSIGSFHEKDEWIKEFILQFEDVPVLNIICGREKITWDKSNPEWKTVVEQHLMGELSNTDCKSFLHSCNITDENIQNTIIKGSEGLPYYLDIMVDTYQLVSRKRIPAVDDFSKRPEEVLQRFLKYLDRPEKETLKILSIPRFWSESLFSDLVTEFKTFYPTTAFDELCEFSFIQELDQSGDWSMHNLMKQGLYDQVLTQSSSLFNQVHRFLFHYYTERLETKESDVPPNSAFVEALYHGEFVFNEDELIDWVSRYSVILLNSGKWSTLIQEYERILEYKSDQKLHAHSHHNLGELYTLKGQYDLAEKHSIYAIKLYEDKLLSHNNDKNLYKKIAQLQKRLGDLYRNKNDYEKAIYILLNSIEHLEKITEEDIEALQEIAFISTRLGKVYKLRSQYDQAQLYYEKALEKSKRIIDSGHKSSSIYATLGQVYEKLGELANDELKQGEKKDINYFHHAIDAYNQALLDHDIKDYIPVLAHKGLAYKRLAESISVDTDAKEKLANFNHAMTIYNEVIDHAPDYLDGYEMRGHAAVDMLDLYTDLGDFTEGYQCFKLAVTSFERALELSEVQGSSRNRLSSAYRSLGRQYRKQKNYSLAIEAFDTALKKSDELFLYSPEYIYAHNSRGKIYKEMGDCYLDMQDQDNALNSYVKSLDCFEASREKTPNSKTALAYIEKITGLVEQLSSR